MKDPVSSSEFQLPANFNVLQAEDLPFELAGGSLEDLQLKPSADAEARPFLHLGDGGVLAFWFLEGAHVIVHIGAHGESDVVAQSFNDFLKAVNAKTTGLSDIDDEDEEEIRIPGFDGEPETEQLPALRVQFAEWLEHHSALQKPLRSPEAEVLRQQAFGIVEEMLRDGLSKVYTLEKPWWSMGITVKRSGSALELSYLDFGKWYPVPAKYGLESVARKLVALAQDPNKDEFKLSVVSAGIVSLDNDRELVLAPPE